MVVVSGGTKRRSALHWADVSGLRWVLGVALKEAVLRPDRDDEVCGASRGGRHREDHRTDRDAGHRVGDELGSDMRTER